MWLLVGCSSEVEEGELDVGGAQPDAEIDSADVDDTGGETIDTGEDTSDADQSAPDAGDAGSDTTDASGDADSDADDVSPPADPCSEPARQPPPGWTRLSSGDLSCVMTQQGWDRDADCREFEGIWPTNFIDASNLSKHLGIRSDDGRDYMAIRISTQGLDSTHTGGIGVNISAWFKGRRKIMTISPCPGDFDQESNLEESGCYMESFTQNLRWGGVDSGQPCRLEADREYYWNILYTNDDPGTPAVDIQPNPDCVESSQPCGNLYAP